MRRYEDLSEIFSDKDNYSQSRELLKEVSCYPNKEHECGYLQQKTAGSLTNVIILWHAMASLLICHVQHRTHVFPNGKGLVVQRLKKWRLTHRVEHWFRVGFTDLMLLVTDNFYSDLYCSQQLLNAFTAMLKKSLPLQTDFLSWYTVPHIKYT